MSSLTTIPNALLPITFSESARITRPRPPGKPARPAASIPYGSHSLSRQAAAHEAVRAAEAAREAEKRAEQIRAAAAAVKQQQKADKSAAGTL